MTQNITSYYIPQNLNITKGKIYTLYLNKATNLDLTSIIPKKDLTLQGIIQPQSINQSTSPITLTEEAYTSILSLADETTKLYNQTQELVKKLTKGNIRQWMI